MLLSCGDALIDFLPVKSSDGRDALLPAVGGSCLNVAIGMARLGAPTSFVGGISTDLFGRMIADHAQASQVELQYATRSPRPTTLAFVRSVDGTGNDVTRPDMGAAGAAFGRNVPPDETYPTDVLSPNPRRVSRELLTRDQFQPAEILNLLAAAWIQFMVHDWLAHKRSETEVVEIATPPPWLLTMP